MPSYRTQRVVEILDERSGIQRIGLDDDSRAYALTGLVGSVAVGDEVVVNTTAVDAGLGTGGWHVVHWNLAHRHLHLPGAGHIMKLRYTSLQADTGAAEELGEDTSSSHEAAPLPDLGGTPVLVGGLHSQVGVAAVVAKALQPELRISYVMTDGAALPLAISDLVHGLVARGLLDGTITAGHAFGGDLEAVSTPSALNLAVERQRADLVICAMGPGVVGTASPLGTTAVEVASIAAAAQALGARPFVMCRASSGDSRERHRGISHHTLTALRLSPLDVEVVLPPELSGEAARIRPHRVHIVEPPDVGALLRAVDLRVTTMGRGPEEDPLFFRAVAAAVAHVVAVLRGSGTVGGS
jgi:hypothetical protein